MGSSGNWPAQSARGAERIKDVSRRAADSSTSPGSPVVQATDLSRAILSKKLAGGASSTQPNSSSMLVSKPGSSVNPHLTLGPCSPMAGGMSELNSGQMEFPGAGTFALTQTAGMTKEQRGDYLAARLWPQQQDVDSVGVPVEPAPGKAADLDDLNSTKKPTGGVPGGRRYLMVPMSSR